MGVNLPCGSQSTRKEERLRETEADFVLCVDLCVSVRLVIKGEEGKHHNWMFISDA